MAAKIVILLCLQALLIQEIYCQNVCGTAAAAEEYALAGNALAANALAANLAGNALAANGIAGNGLPYGASLSAVTGYSGSPLLANPYGFAPTSGGSFSVQSISPITPTGIRVASENAIEGAITISGGLPFLGAVALDGVLPTAGAGGINYGCGNGAVGIMNENLAAAPVGPIGGAYSGLGYNGIGPGLGLPGVGSGRGLGYGIGGCGV